VPANAPTQMPFPIRGVPGGWADPWDEPIDDARLREQAEAAERQQLMPAEILGVVWQREIREERRHVERTRKRRSGLGGRHRGAPGTRPVGVGTNAGGACGQYRKSGRGWGGVRMLPLPKTRIATAPAPAPIRH
jgi:hypothetical protein